jgi:hypothetical protein
MTWEFVATGTNGKGQSWKTAGTVQGTNFEDALAKARHANFDHLMDQQRFPPLDSAACGGPYRIKSFSLKEV